LVWLFGGSGGGGSGRGICFCAMISANKNVEYANPHQFVLTRCVDTLTRCVDTLCWHASVELVLNLISAVSPYPSNVELIRSTTNSSITNPTWFFHCLCTASC
jgi:hypothetical protein